MAAKKPHHPMHIKSRTQGSSNEISFSVLDAAREARDAEERERRDAAAGKVSLFTLGKGGKPRSTPAKSQSIVLSGGASAPSSGTSTVERGLRGIVPAVVVICVLLALALVAGQALLSMKERQTSLRDTLNAQFDILNQCDEILIPFDKLVMEQYDPKRLVASATGDRAPSSSALVEGYRAVVADIAPARTQLEEVIAAVEALQPSLSDNTDKEAAAQAVTAARSRLNMLDAGVSIIEESLMATEAFLDARAGWKAVIDADAAAREATALMEEMTEQNVRGSQAKSEEALSLLEQAQGNFAQAEAVYPGLALESFNEYVARRLASQQAALAADAAYLARNKEELAAENDRYNALEAEAADLAQNLGEDDPERLVANRFYAAIESDKAAYEAERLKAGNADAFLREYLGTSA
ncbi:hypothetical protein [Adlercreutzia shanghongiae]|uniref:LemA family protein n=1 Tax=Adlercreutzia shanghongiae TaxID=3111773 RepID=A0ABU6IVC4_9ACTN|nr:hypothetical protein [Adlercreutzia sp. R22]MEC4293779.1 hypothetical protein [Adlercreutzia sp. R22]